MSFQDFRIEFFLTSFCGNTLQRQRQFSISTIFKTAFLRMKLFYSSTGNGVASFLAANCIGLTIACEAIDAGTVNPKTTDGTNFTKINKSGTVPCLLFPDLSILTGEPTILAFIADKKKGRIAPWPGNLSRYRVDQFIVSVATNVNVTIDELRVPILSTPTQELFRNRLVTALQSLDTDFQDNRLFAVEGAFTIADIYLYAVLKRLNSVGVSLITLPVTALNTYFIAIGAREDITRAEARMSSSPGTTAVVEIGSSGGFKCGPWVC